MSAKTKKEKEKKKGGASGKQEASADVPELAAVQVHFKVETIKNFQNFNKLSNEFSLELIHCGKPITSTSVDNGKFYLTQPPYDSLSVEDSANTVDLNLHYMMTVKPGERNDVVLLADCPLFIVLNVLTENIHQFEEHEGGEEGGEVDAFPNIFDKPDESKEDSDQEPELKGAKLKASRSRTTVDSKKMRDKGRRETKKTKDPSSVAETGPVIHKIPIGYGYLDLIQIITTKPLDNRYEIYVYPEITYPNIKTPKIVLYVYSAIGILKNTPLRFCNILTMTLENIFNLNETVVQADVIRVDFSLFNEALPDQRHKLFSFTDGRIEKFQDGKMNKRWSGLPAVKGLGTMTMYPNDSSLHKVYVENFEIFSDIDNYSYVYNFDSIHRIILTEEDSLNLEDYILRNSQQISVEIFIDDDETARYLGYADLAPLLYPGVHQGRFSVELKLTIKSVKQSVMFKQPHAKSPPKPKEKMQSQHKLLPGDNIPITVKSTRPSSHQSSTPVRTSSKQYQKKDKVNADLSEQISKHPDGVLFLVFAIDLLKPLTERTVPEDCDCAKITDPPCGCEETPEIDEVLLQKITRTELEDEIITILKALPTCTEDVMVETDDGMKVKCDEFQNLECYKEMRDNLMEKITKFTAANYCATRRTTTNAEFKDLMTGVYNDLSLRTEEVVNDYYAGSKNFLDVRQIYAIQNVRMTTAFECWHMGFINLSEIIWEDMEIETEDDEFVSVDLIVKDLLILHPVEAREKLNTLLQRNPNNYFGLLINLYMIYKNDKSDTVTWLSPLLKLVKEYPNEVELWVLLHVVFTSFSYRPGFKHAKMNCESNFPPKDLPYSWGRRDLHYDVDDKNDPFCYSIYLFMQLRLWDFANLIFESFKHLFDETQRNRIKCVILYRQKDVAGLKKYLNVVRSSPSPANKFLVYVYTGHLKYDAGKRFDAIMDYILAYHRFPDEFLLIPYLRIGFYALEQGNFEDAKGYFWTCCINFPTFISWFGLGRSLYGLKKYEKAEVAFSKASNIFGKAAEVWIYLAMINIALKKYETAQMCCEVATRFTVHEPELEEEMYTLFRDANIAMPPKF